MKAARHLRTSPYNSPDAQRSRLLDSRRMYFQNCSEAAKHVFVSAFLCIFLFLWGFALVFGAPVLGYPMMITALGVPTYFRLRYFLYIHGCLTGNLGVPSAKRPLLCSPHGYADIAEPLTLPRPREEKSPTWLEACSNSTVSKLPHSLSCFKCREHIVFDPSKFYRSPNEIAYLQGYPPTPLKPPAPAPDRPPKWIDEHLH